MSRPFDFIIFGATGFTGKYCVFQAPKLFAGYKWAVAGRSRPKLGAMLKEIGTELGVDLSSTAILLADVADRPSLSKLTSQCRVLINCCGPFVMYGEPVVQACIESATDYVDVAAEPQFMEKMQLEYHARAQEQNVYSISACGFDSVLCEMGLSFAEKAFKGTIHSTEIYIKIWDQGPLLGATVNYGTWHSMVEVFSKNKELEDVRKELSKSGNFEFPLPKLKTKIICKSPVTKNWYVPFVNIDQSVSKRTQRYFHETEKKRPIQIREYYDLGWTCLVPVLAVICASFLFLLSRFQWGIKLLLKYPGLFSLGQASKEGPNREKFTTAQFQHTFHSKGWSEGEEVTDNPTHEIVTVVSGVNPAYGATCICLLLSALSLVAERERIPGW